MAHYSETSKRRLATCELALQKLFAVVILAFDHTILCGHRSEKLQEQAFRQGRTRCRWPESNHNAEPSRAVDAGPYNPERKNVDWPDESVMASLRNSPTASRHIKTLCRWYYFGGFVMGCAHALGIKLRWGGDWDNDTLLHDQTFDDLPHFELREDE